MQVNDESQVSWNKKTTSKNMNHILIKKSELSLAEK
jgi:hypothetical protein